MRPTRHSLLLGLVVCLGFATCDRPTRTRGVMRPVLLTASLPPLPDAVVAVAPPPVPPPAVAKTNAVKQWRRAFVAYLLWFFFGIFGAHHLYLGRNRAALLCSITVGGSGFGLLLDAIRMPRYVRELGLAEDAAAAAAAAAADALAAATPRPRPLHDFETPHAGDSLRTAEGRAFEAEAPSPPAVVSASAATAPPARPLGVLSASFRLLWRLLLRVALGKWIAFNLHRLLPAAAAAAAAGSSSALPSVITLRRRLLSAMVQVRNEISPSLCTLLPSFLPCVSRPLCSFPYLTFSHLLSPSLTFSHHLSPSPTSSHHLSPSLTISHHLPPPLTISHHLPPPLTSSHHLSPPLTTSHHLSPPLTSSHHLSPPHTFSHIHTVHACHAPALICNGS